jgi:branched-chain amino acid transport system ATP-binding protein
MTNPALLLLDEPLEGLAPIIVEDIAAALQNLQGMTVVLVEQHTDIALSLTEDAVVIERGRIVHRARSAELARDPEMAERVLGLNVR